MFKSILMVSAIVGSFTLQAFASQVQEWGGKSVELQVFGQSATIQFDCAFLKVKAGWVANSNGIVVAKGLYYPGSGVAFPPGQEPQPVAATVWAKINVDGMTLKVKTAGQVSTYSLQLGQQGELNRCM